ncbi:MAG: hypothetical protein ACP5Q4_10245 [Candidatus Caldatribacteriaceae bacterium]
MKKWMGITMVRILLVGMLLSGCGSSGGAPQAVIKARDWGIKEARQEGIAVPQNVTWSAQNTTPPMLLGYTTYSFIHGDFRIEVGYPVVLSPIYAVAIFQNGNLVWEGTIEEQDLP